MPILPRKMKQEIMDFIFNNSRIFDRLRSMVHSGFKNEHFTQVLISAVVHHIDNETLEAISRELRRILSKNGEIMIIDHFVRKKQKNLLCKFLIDLDRGSFFRNPKEVIEIFSKDFKVKKMKNFKNGPYKDYFLILKKS